MVVMHSAPVLRAVLIREMKPPVILIAPVAGAVREVEAACAQIALVVPLILPPETFRIALPLAP